MSENTAPAMCSEREYQAARDAGLLVVTTADEIAIHKFAQAMRASAPQPLTHQRLVEIELGLRKYTDGDRYDLSLADFARAIEAAHGIAAATHPA